ncbi:MAG: protein kinase [Planctomycetota bacterium]
MTRPVLNGRYRLLDELGRGGMATVFRGLDLSSGREVAIKVLQGAVQGQRRERFLREGQVLGGLRHPGIVGIHDAGEHLRRPYLVMEHSRGGASYTDLVHAVLEQRVQ